MINMKLRNGGWQVNVEYFDDYVIKTPKTKEETSNKISKHLEKKDKIHELEDTIDKIQNDWKSSIKIIKNSNIPLKYLAFPEFLKEGKIKQRKVDMLVYILNDLFKKNKFNEIEIIAKELYEFIWTLWSYGFNEKTYKIGTEFGILNDQMVLIDLGELSNNKEDVKKQIMKKKWSGLKIINLYAGEKSELIFKKLAEEMLTLEKLNEVWGSKLK